jgi:hypothetical protein
MSSKRRNGKAAKAAKPFDPPAPGVDRLGLVPSQHSVNVALSLVKSALEKASEETRECVRADFKSLEFTSNVRKELQNALGLPAKPSVNKLDAASHEDRIRVNLENLAEILSLIEKYERAKTAATGNETAPGQRRAKRDLQNAPKLKYPRDKTESTAKGDMGAGNKTTDRVSLEQKQKTGVANPSFETGIFDATAKGALGELASLTEAASDVNQSGHSFLALEERFFNLISVLTDSLTGMQTASALQQHLDALAGRSYGDEVNGKWVDLLNNFLKTRGYRVACVGKDCEDEPSLLKWIESNNQRLVFKTEHTDKQGKQARHGGGSTIPTLVVMRA